MLSNLKSRPVFSTIKLYFVPLLFISSITTTSANMAGGASSQWVNVMKKPLHNFSKNPMTGFYRDGYCRVGPDDTGNHSVASTLTDSFLDFTASRGSNLRSIGLTAGCKWCLCAGRWKEALDAASRNKDLRPDVVPRVHLQATHERALDVVSIEDLKANAATPEAASTSDRFA